MGEAENFEEMITERPKDAFAYVIDHEGSVFYRYALMRCEREMKASYEDLRKRPLDKLEFVRGYMAGVEFFKNLPETVKSEILDEIELQKAAEPVEDARKPEGKEGKL